MQENMYIPAFLVNESAWLKPHSGDYDVTEAYAWLDEVLAAE